MFQPLLGRSHVDQQGSVGELVARLLGSDAFEGGAGFGKQVVDGLGHSNILGRA